MLVWYDYLWDHEYESGRREGSKRHPCAVIAASKIDENGDRKVLLCGISHMPMENPNDGVKLPVKLQKYMGLDQGEQWVWTNQYNEEMWSDPEIQVMALNEYENARLPKALYDTVRESVVQHKRERDITQIDRTEDNDQDNGWNR